MSRGNRTKRTRFHSLEHQQEVLRLVSEGMPIPDGITFDTKEEHEIWVQFSSARSAKDWRTLDLVILARVVQFEYRIRVNERLVKEEGEIVTNSRGTPIENPRNALVARLINRQTNLIRSLSLMAGMGTGNGLSGTDLNKGGARPDDGGGKRPRKPRRDPDSLLLLDGEDE